MGCGGISRSLQRLLEPFGVTILGLDPPLPVEVMVARAIRRVVDDLEALAAGRAPSAMQYLSPANLAGLQQRPPG